MDLLDLAALEHQRASAEFEQQRREQLADLRGSTQVTLQECQETLQNLEADAQREREAVELQERLIQARRTRQALYGSVAIIFAIVTSVLLFMLLR